MKLLSFIIGLFGLITLFVSEIVTSYHYEKQYSQHWSLADKSSTIPAKQKHIADFVAALERGNANGQFAGHNVIFMQTPNNSFEANLTALKTLSQRLSEIQEMSPSSFEYNTAIQQITAQEQGEANQMLDTIESCYVLAVNPAVWKWISLLIVCPLLLLIAVPAIIWFVKITS